jgi:hypothetical protein
MTPRRRLSSRALRCVAGRVRSHCSGRNRARPARSWTWLLMRG